MKKFYFLLFFCLSMLGFGQAVQLYNPADDVVYPNEQYFCNGEKFNLKVDAVASSTGDYKMTRVYASDFDLSAGSIPINFPSSGADKFSESVPIGFSFSFYGKTYTKVVMGSNGRLVFTSDVDLENLKNNTVYTDRTFSGVAGYNTYSNLPSTDYNKVFKANPAQELNLAQIFFGYTDLVPKSANGSVVYLYKNVVVPIKSETGPEIIDTNGLMISFQNQIRTNGTGGISSAGYYSYVLLLEDGKVVIYVNNKSEITYNAILGIQNDDASRFKVPEHPNTVYNYNNGPWKSEGTATLFTPNQNLTPVFTWTNNGVPVGTNSDSLNDFVPSDGDILKLEVTYLDDDGNQDGGVVSGQIIFRKVRTPVIEKSIRGCNIILNILSPDPGLTYKWYREGDPSSLSLFPVTQWILNSLSTPDRYYAVPIKPDGTSCTGSNKIEIKEFFPPRIKNQLVVCDNTASPASSKFVNLYTEFYPQYSAPSSFEEYDVDFFDSNGLVTNPANYEVPKNKIVSITIRRKLKSQPPPYCETDIVVKINFVSIPSTLTIPVCFSTTSFDLKNNFEARFPDAAYNYTFTYSDGSPVEDGTAVNVTRVVNVKTSVLPSPACSTNTSVTFNLGSTIDVPPVPMQQRCQGSYTNSNRFDFNYIKTLLDPLNLYDIKFYNKSDDSEIRPVESSPITNPNLNLSGYFWTAKTGDYFIYAKLINRADPSCFSPSEYIVLRVNVSPATIAGYQSKLRRRACGSSLVNLEIRDVFDIIESNTFGQIPTVKYFDRNRAEILGPDIMNYDISRGIPYIEIQNGTCSPPLKLDYEIISNKFVLLSPPLEILCDDLDENSDGKIKVNLASNSFKDKFTTNQTGATFSYFDGSNLIYTSTISSDNFEYEITDGKTITVKVFSDLFCENQSSISFKINNSTPIEFSGKVDLCYNDDLILKIDNLADFSSIEWLDPKGILLGSGNSISVQYKDVLFGQVYKIKATNANGCITEYIFTPSDSNQPKIVKINQTNNSIEVIAEGGDKEYWYHFNKIRQRSPILQNPTEPKYIIKVESENGCFGPPKTVYFIKINNAFTPNGDGKNDVWKIENLDKMEQVSIVIVDRTGTKVFESTNPSKSEWDGKHNGQALPTSTYWYVVSWFDAVRQITEQRQGWILLKNRN
ncbi:T9SS type B sorting domain-containing protein [Kaistella antarctica]|nr:T9SS type B sorting domain-containing protein [Kaistella antarctica]